MLDLNSENENDLMVFCFDMKCPMNGIIGLTEVMIFDDMSRTEIIELNDRILLVIHQMRETFKKIEYKHDVLVYFVSKMKHYLTMMHDFYIKNIENYDNLPKSKFIELNELALYNAQTVFKLVRDIVNVKKFKDSDGTRIRCNLNKVDILSKIQYVINNYTKLAEIKNIDLLLHKISDNHHAFVDSFLVHDILDNLVSNAIKYSPCNKSIDIHICSFEKMIRCEIKDEGPGLSQPKQMFNFIIPQSIGNEYSNGIGLFLVKNWVELMRGKVWYESELGKGTSFFVEFPIFDFQT